MGETFHSMSFHFIFQTWGVFESAIKKNQSQAATAGSLSKSTDTTNGSHVENESNTSQVSNLGKNGRIEEA